MTIPAIAMDDSNDKLHWLQEQTQLALDRAQALEGWYADKIRPKRFWARHLRLGMLVCGGLAGLIPMLATETLPWLGQINAIWASIFAALGAFLLAVDRFYGHGGAWMRYIKARNAVVSLHQQFYLDWQIEKARLALTDPDFDAIQAWLEQVKAFQRALDQVLAQDVEEWISAFEQQLKQAPAGLKTLK
ncbi:SLATT domain-containing protein [Gallaecimonas sp. GXIMD4217]|uniref:SLATT domain-containing protein n=1 Tax=Gallaecimonas sp. GXIMD4217 TaxID=3131927 RepID=UPI00311B299D